MIGERILCPLVLIVSLVGVAWGGPITYSLDPRSSFLRAGLTDDSVGPLFIPLSTLQLSPGQRVTLQMSGVMSFWTGSPLESSLPYLVYELGVFTVDASLGPTTSLNRLTAVGNAPPEGAEGVIDPVTFYGGLSTDIPQDFKIPFGPGSVTLTIPVGANFLAVAVRDSFFADNNTPFEGRLVFDLTIPEPATGALILIGLSGFFALRQQRGHGRPEN